jgi:hypothetical protein
MEQTLAEKETNAESEFFIAPIVDMKRVKETVDAVIEFMRSVMVNDIDYGVIPGTNKPSLLKPGAEKLVRFFGLRTRSTIMNVVSSDDPETPFYTVTIKTEILKGNSDVVISDGLGTASTLEDRYASRWVTEAKLPKDVEKSTLSFRIKDSKFGKGTYTEYLWKPTLGEHYFQRETVLQMADKRSYVAAVRKATAASMIFTQDMEDAQPAHRETPAKAIKEEIPKQTNFGEPAASQEQVERYIQLVNANSNPELVERAKRFIRQAGAKNFDQLSQSQADQLLNLLTEK